jgi:release factor glutamine methyltransferase
VEAVLELSRGIVVDVGSGSGAIAITLALETGATVLATDISERALTVACGNARALQASVQFVVCDLLSAFSDGSVGLVVSNPPYVSEGAITQREVLEWEPHGALFAGADGLDLYRRLVPEARRVLQPGGSLALELGFDSLPGVRQLLNRGWHEPRIIPDLAGIPRVLVSERAD